MLNFNSEEKALCMWLVEGLVSEIGSDAYNTTVDVLPMNEKIKLIQSYIGVDQEAFDIKKSINEEYAIHIYNGNGYDDSGMNEHKRLFVSTILYWINGKSDCLEKNKSFKEFDQYRVSESDIIETAYHITHQEPEPDAKDWLYYKEQYISDYKYKRNWDVDYITSPKSANEAIGALDFIKDEASHVFLKSRYLYWDEKYINAMRLIIDICNNDFKDDIIVKRNLPIYLKFLDDIKAEEEKSIEDEKNDRKKANRELLSKVLICVFGIIAIGIEVPLLHWWAILSGTLTVIIVALAYAFIDDWF